MAQCPAHVSIVKWEVASVQQQEATPSPGTCTLMVRLQVPARAACRRCGTE